MSGAEKAAAPVGETGADTETIINSNQADSDSIKSMPFNEMVGKLFDCLGVSPHERVSLCYEPLGGAFTYTLGTAETVAARANPWRKKEADVWVGVNPVREGIPGSSYLRWVEGESAADEEHP